MPHTSAQAAVCPDATDLAGGICLHAVVFVVAFVIVCSRRPDAVLNAQFYAEDGAVWYSDAYRLGLHSLMMPQSGYLHILTRLVALFALLFPFSWAPLILNLSAITVQVLPVNVFLSSRFAAIAFPLRLLACFLYLALPNTFEIDANVTNVQWHLALLACLLLLARPARSRGWKVFDAAVLVLTSFSSPMGILLVPVAAVLWWKRRNTWSAATLALLSPGAVVQVLTVLLHWQSRQTPHSNLAGETILNGGANGANVVRFAAIMGRQVFLSSLLGVNTQNWLLRLDDLHTLEAIAAAIGFAFLLYGLCSGPIELKLFILFALAVLTLGLVSPLAGPPDHPQWYWLCTPGCGNRYYFLPMLAFLASLLWVASRAATASALRSLRGFAIVLLLLLPIGIYRDWHYPPYVNFDFHEYAERFERVPSGTKVIIPTNPDWLMELPKH